MQKRQQRILDDTIRFRKIIENSHEGVTLFDKDFNILYRSTSTERINGWSTTGRKTLDLNSSIHPDDRQYSRILINEVLENPGTSKTITFRSRHFKGHYIWLECVFSNLLDDPDVEAIVCNFRDITETKQAEAALKQTLSELYAYKYALDESSIVAITDQKGIIKHVNANFCRISKYSESELVGQDHRIINSGYHDKAFIRNLWVTIASGEIWKGELKNKAKDGSFYWVDTTIVPFLNEYGKPYQYVAIRSDITERKLSNEKIIESERFIKTITDNLPAMVAYWSADLNCLFANKPYLEWFGKSADEMLGINKRDLLDKDEFKLHESHITHVLSGIPQSFERTFHRNDGKTIYTHTQYLPDTENNIVKGFYSLIYDLTEVKFAEKEVQKKTQQIADLLENITDGFIALDENLCYSYANKRISEMLGRPAQDLVGKYIWDLFPDAIGSPTYEAIQTAFAEKRYICNEDYYAPLKLWQENRVYPAERGISMFIRDITKTKNEEHHLKLLESVITNTTDAVLITEAEPFDEPSPRIVYVNEAFTKLTGYSAAEVIGKTPRILQGINTDKNEMKRLSAALRKWQPCEVTVINYKKNGEEFWNNFTLNPVADEKGWFTHWISIDRDVTQRKKEELEKALLADISFIFNEPIALNILLDRLLQRLTRYGTFILAEVWLISADKNKINLAATLQETAAITQFYKESEHIKSFRKGEGPPGATWQEKKIKTWYKPGKNEFLRWQAAQKIDLQRVYTIPLVADNLVIGVLLLGLDGASILKNDLSHLFETISTHFGIEIKRKQLEQELNLVFDNAPDIIVMLGIDRYFKRVNPAMSRLLEYTEEELLANPLNMLIHPDDVEASKARTTSLIESSQTLYFENRLVTRSGKIIWVSWTANKAADTDFIFAVGKDISDKKELEELLYTANTLARIGSWEVDAIKGTVYWSDITKEIHEAPADFEPGLESAVGFYKEGHDRDTIVQLMNQSVNSGDSVDVELQIITLKGNTKWIRVIGKAEFNNKQCIRLYGSFQDIDERKRAEIAGKQALEERNVILESIDDAFFAVNKDWTVTYWNNMAAKVLNVPVHKIINKNLWDVFADSVDSESYKNYHEAIASNYAVHFEDYYPTLSKWYEISAYPSDTGLSVYFKDISERKLADSRLRQLNDSLKKHARDLAISNAELEQFAYVASHDLQEPLRMVTSFLTQLDKKYNSVIDDKGKQYIHFAVDGAKRMRQIILDLLDFSRVGRTEDEPEDIDVNKLINEILPLYRKQIEELKATIKFSALPIIQSYKTPIRQVFQNLIGNSLKYHRTQERPLIKISCVETQALYQFSVQDDGIGIDAEYFDKIFIIFQRLHNKDEYSGTGMGLAISKKIVENLGGKIWVESSEGIGSTFHFTVLKTHNL